MILRDGRKAVVRIFDPDDKEGLVSFFASMSPEALKWGLPPYDRQRIERWLLNLANGVMLVAEFGCKIVGNLYVWWSPAERVKHSGELLIYLHQDFQKAGLGTAMMRRAIEEARSRALHRLQLTVIADNLVAIRLYEKVGFKQEGMRKDAFRSDDGRFHDALEMGLLL